MVPKNITHLLQPSYLTTNGAIKKMENCAFSEYFRNRIARELLKDPVENVTTIHVRLKLSTLKPKHGKVMCQMKKRFLFLRYSFLKSHFCRSEMIFVCF